MKNYNTYFQLLVAITAGSIFFGCHTSPDKAKQNISKIDSLEQTIGQSSQANRDVDSLKMGKPRSDNKYYRIGQVYYIGDLGDEKNALGLLKLHAEKGNDCSFAYFKDSLHIDSALYTNKNVKIDWTLWADTTMDEANTFNLINKIEILNK